MSGKTHGMFGTKFYYKYFAIVQRCNDPKATSYPRYGAKGIRNLWGSFEEFRDDMYASYLKHVEEYGERQTTIDRIDSKGNYSKENCRWATMTEQARNTSKNRFMVLNGVSKNISAWCEELGLNQGTVLSRLNRGWTPEKATSNKRHNRFDKRLIYKFRGESRPLVDWSKELGIKYPTLYRRVVLAGKSVEEAFTTKVK